MDSLGFYPILLALVGAGPESRGGELKHQNLQKSMRGMTKDHSWSPSSESPATQEEIIK